MDKKNALEVEIAELKIINEQSPLKKWRGYWSRTGPGWMQSAVTLGGATAMSSLFSGALMQYDLLWVQPVAMLLAIIMLSALSYQTLMTGQSAKNCVDIVESVNSTHLKLSYDPGNFVWGNKITDNVISCWPLMKHHVVHVHIKDWKLGCTDIGAMPGEGDGQILELLKELSRNNYFGFITMEPHLRVGGQFGGDTGPELFADAVAATLRLCIKAGLKFKKPENSESAKLILRAKNSFWFDVLFTRFHKLFGEKYNSF